MLYTTVQIDGQHALRTGRDSSGSQCIAKAIVLYFITQTAAATQRVGIVTHIGEE